MTPAPKRRWSFSLRTLFVVVTFICVLVGAQLSLIHERQRIQESIIASGGQVSRDTFGSNSL